LERKLVKRVKESYRNRVRQCRLKALIRTQAELARLTGIPRGNINNIENDRLFLSSYYALLIAEVLGCSVSDLYQRKDGADGK